MHNAVFIDILMLTIHGGCPESQRRLSGRRFYCTGEAGQRGARRG